MKKALLAFLALFGAIASSCQTAKKEVTPVDTVAPVSLSQTKHDEETDADYIDDAKVMVNYAHLGKDKLFDAVYSEEVFFSESDKYHHLLAKQSIGLALAAFKLYEEDLSKDDTGNLLNYFYMNGYEDIRIDDYDKDTSMYTVGTAIASKTIRKGDQEADLVAVAIRGGKYKNEWQSNLTVDIGVRHQGFDSAATLVTDRILSYIGQHMFTRPLKIWITGFSRAGAIANVTAANLNSSNVLTEDQVYAYTFAAPAAIWTYDGDEKNGEKNRNIFNILGASDFIPQFVPGQWSYKRFGNDLYLPGAEFNSDFQSKYGVIQERLKKEQGIDTYYNVDFNMRLRLFFGILLELAVDEYAYSDLLQPFMVDILRNPNPQSLTVLLRETLQRWKDSFPDLDPKKDAVIDYAVGFLPSILFGNGFMKGQVSTTSSNVKLLAHEHFPELYLYHLYSLSEKELFGNNDRFAYVSLRSTGRFTLRDAAANQEILTIDNGEVTHSEYAKSQNIALSTFKVKQKTILVLPFDHEYEVTYSLSKHQSMETLVVPYDRVFTSNLVQHRFDLKRVGGDENGTLLRVRADSVEYAGPLEEVQTTGVAKYLGVDKGLFHYRFSVILMVFMISILLVGLAWLLAFLSAKAKKTRLNPLRMGLISGVIVCAVEGEVAFWILADMMLFNIIFKALAGAFLLALCLIGRKLSELKKIHKTVIPAVLLLIAGNICLSFHIVAGISCFLAALAYLAYLNLSGKRMRSPLWWIYGVSSFVGVGAALMLLHSITVPAILFYAMVPIALLTAFSGASYGGKKEVTNYVLILSFLMLGLYLFSGLSFLSSVLYVVFFNIALGMYCLRYDQPEESPAENSPEEPVAEPAPKGE